MPLAYSTDDRHAWVEALLARHPIDGVDLAIDARDEMLAYAAAQGGSDRDSALVAYFSSGLQVARSLQQLADAFFGGFDGVERLLDFGCGFGRVTRFLAARAGAHKIWVSDLLPDALRFQSSRFGVQSMPSSEAAATLECEPRFDLIYVGSLFTHLPDRTFGDWLEKLASLLTPQGLLAFSVHDEVLLPPEHEMSELGIFFKPSSESRSLDHQEYGSAWVTEKYVSGQIQRLPGWSWRRIARGLCNYQDLYLLARDAALDLSELSYDGGPDTKIETCDVSHSGELSLEGWSISRFSVSEAETIEVALDGRPVAEASVAAPRPDCFEKLGDVGLSEERIAADGLSEDRLLHSGWQCRGQLPLPLSRSSSVLEVNARGRQGVSNPVFVGSLEQLLYRTAEENFRRHYQRVYELEQAIRNMKNSRFWWVRDRWFWVKRALGLTDEA